MPCWGQTHGCYFAFELSIVALVADVAYVDFIDSHVAVLCATSLTNMCHMLISGINLRPWGRFRKCGAVAN